MTSLVIDASSIVDLVSGSERGDLVRAEIRAGTLHAPDFVATEVASAIARLERAGEDPRAAGDAVRLFARMPITSHPARSLVEAAWQLRQSLRVTDAFYVALARSLGLTLLTTDRRLGRAVDAQSLCDIRVVE